MSHSPLFFSSLLFLSKSSQLSNHIYLLPNLHFLTTNLLFQHTLPLSSFYQMDSDCYCSKGLFLALGLVGEEETTSKIGNRGPGLKSSLSFIGSNGGSEPSLRLGLSDDGLCRQASPLSPVSSFCSGRAKREREFSSEDVEAEKVSSRVSDEDEDGSNYRKKLRLTKEQSALLEDSFKQHSTLNQKQKQAIARQLNLRPRQVEVWFQNRRARTKVKQTEVDCELLKKCCENLAEENRRLQKEVDELKAVKRAHPFYVQMPATAATLSLCPSCQRVGRDGHGRSAASSSELPFSVASSSSNPHFFNPFTNSSAAC